MLKIGCLVTQAAMCLIVWTQTRFPEPTPKTSTRLVCYFNFSTTQTTSYQLQSSIDRFFLSTWLYKEQSLYAAEWPALDVIPIKPYLVKTWHPHINCLTLTYKRLSRIQCAVGKAASAWESHPSSQPACDPPAASNHVHHRGFISHSVSFIFELSSQKLAVCVYSCPGECSPLQLQSLKWTEKNGRKNKEAGKQVNRWTVVQPIRTAT